jgi:hypothetical protein
VQQPVGLFFCFVFVFVFDKRKTTKKKSNISNHRHTSTPHYIPFLLRLPPFT